MSVTIVRVLRGNPRWGQTTFQQADEQGVLQPTDPPDVFFTVTSPTTTTTTHYGDAGSPILKEAVGTYRGPVANDAVGDWLWRLSAPGFAAAEGWFAVYDYMPTDVP